MPYKLKILSLSPEQRDRWQPCHGKGRPDLHSEQAEGTQAQSEDPGHRSAPPGDQVCPRGDAADQAHVWCLACGEVWVVLHISWSMLLLLAWPMGQYGLIIASNYGSWPQRHLMTKENRTGPLQHEQGWDNTIIWLKCALFCCTFSHQTKTAGHSGQVPWTQGVDPQHPQSPLLVCTFVWWSTWRSDWRFAIL